MKKQFIPVILAAVVSLAIPSLFMSLTVNDDRSDEESNASHTEIKDIIFSPVETMIRVIDNENRLVQMDLNSYLLGVLLREMPANFELEALKAQAVVARTYALMRNLKGDKHSNYAVCTDSSCCQGYWLPEDYLSSGGDPQAVERIKQAVEDTHDLVITYSGELNEANYFSCSGGKTEDAQAVWGADIPYLQSVDSPGEEEATHFTDTLKFTAEEFQALIGDDLLGQSGTWIKGITYTEGGGVDTITIGNVTYTGTKIRSLLKLPSTAFVISAVVDTIIITTKGFGHRVGMSQYGADAMAVNGNSFEQILQYYYIGTQLGHWADFV